MTLLLHSSRRARARKPAPPGKQRATHVFHSFAAFLTLRGEGVIGREAWARAWLSRAQSCGKLRVTARDLSGCASPAGALAPDEGLKAISVSSGSATSSQAGRPATGASGRPPGRHRRASGNAAAATRPLESCFVSPRRATRIPWDAS